LRLRIGDWRIYQENLKLFLDISWEKLNDYKFFKRCIISEEDSQIVLTAAIPRIAPKSISEKLIWISGLLVEFFMVSGMITFPLFF
jgi:hypothetical protein